MNIFMLLSCRRAAFFILKYIGWSDLYMEKKKTEKEEKHSVLCRREEKVLLEYIQDLNYGEIKIVVQGGKPVRIEEIKKSIQL